jgi:hypothetical protein
LETKCLEVSYSLKLKELGFRRVDFFLYAAGGDTTSMRRELLKHDDVVSVGRSVGEHTVDLTVDAIMKDSGKLLDLLELMEGLPNVREYLERGCGGRGQEEVGPVRSYRRAL